MVGSTPRWALATVACRRVGCRKGFLACVVLGVKRMETNTIAQNLAIAASVLTIFVMAGGAVRVVLTTGIEISKWAADKWSTISRALVTLAVILILLTMLSVTTTLNELQQMLPSQPVNLPTGAVVAFDRTDGCPSGWRQYGKATGRFIVGTASDLRTGDTGGSREHVLTVEEMPEHDHDVPWHQAGGSRLPARTSLDDDPRRLLDAYRWDTNSRRLSVEKRGQGQPHNNMPPFLALQYCTPDYPLSQARGNPN